MLVFRRKHLCTRTQKQVQLCLLLHLLYQSLRKAGSIFSDYSYYLEYSAYLSMLPRMKLLAEELSPAMML